MRRFHRLLTAVMAATMLASAATLGAGAAAQPNCGGNSFTALTCSGNGCSKVQTLLDKMTCRGENCNALSLLSANSNCKGGNCNTICTDGSCNSVQALMEKINCRDGDCNTTCADGSCDNVQSLLKRIGQGCGNNQQPVVTPTQPATKPAPSPTQPSVVPTEPAEAETEPATEPVEPATVPFAETQPVTQPAAPTTKPAASVDNSGYLAAYEDEVLRLVNLERANYGLSPLTKHDGAAQAARIRAKEIVQSFSHTRPDGRSCFTAASDVGFSYRAAGENIAYGYGTPEQVVNGWMNSEGHRRNILSASYTELGVGCYQSGRTLYWSQFFIG